MTRPAAAFLPAPHRLRRVRWQLTALFTVTSAGALVVLGLLAIRTHDTSLRRSGHDLLLRRADTAVALVHHTRDDTLALDGFHTDPVLDGAPQLFVVAGLTPATATIVLTGNDTGLDLDPAAVRAIALAATTQEDHPTERTLTTSGGRIDLLAEPFYDATGDRPGGAVVVAADPTADSAAHRALVTKVVTGIATLSVVLAAAGYALSGISLRPAQAALRRQERFLAEVAHDLRTPITALATITAAARLPGAEQERLHADASLLTARLARTIDDLLTRAQLSAGTWPVRRLPTRIDLLIEQIRDETTATWPDATITATGDPFVADLDATLIARAVANLIDNSVRHHGPGPAHVTISAGPGRITVTDDGPGLPTPAGDQNTTSGLGLAIAEAVATAHGGTLDLAQAPAGGSIVHLRWPHPGQNSSSREN